MKDVGYELIEFDTVESTNAIAKDLMFLDQEITVFTASHQTSGVGRQGRVWESAKGMGLWLSIVVGSEIELSKIPTISFVAAIAVNSMLREYIGLNSELKWPNDILVKGRKICGILTETNNDGTRIVIGIGLNISHHEGDFPDGINATSIFLENGKSYSPNDLLPVLMEYFEKEYSIFKAECSEKGYSETTIEHWLEHNATIGSVVEFTLNDAQKQGTAVGVNKEGHLIINTSEGNFVNLISGEIQVLTKD